MNRFKLENKPFFECSKLQQDFMLSNVLVGESSKNLDPNKDMLEGDSSGKSKPIDILYRRYIQLKDAWHNKQPADFKDVFELNTYCSEAFAYVSKLETMMEGVKTMYREQWYREQYWTMSKHGFHALLAGTHSIFIIYGFLKTLFYAFLFIVVAVYIYVAMTKENFNLSDSEIKLFLKLGGIWMLIVFVEGVLDKIFGENHRQIIKDNIRKQEVPDSALSAHLLTIAQDTKKLRDDIDFFQQQWIKRLGD